MEKNKKGERTRDRIFFRAGRLFANKGYHAVSVDDIIDGLGIAKGTMYQYFDGKLGLLQELLSYSNIEIEAVFNSIDVKNKDCRSVIKEAYFRLNRLYFNTFDMVALNMASGNMFFDDNELKPIINSIMENFVKLLSPFKNEFRIGQEEVPFVVFLQGEFIRGNLQHHYGQKNIKDEDIMKAVNFALDLLQNGIFKS
ncbi:MAG: TetR/AcrR family transcriptional regulator [Spirochaetes bacterium]|nr:TetR/AcrR family transcriptional regulator [Spirochaetota bacterium]